MKWENEVDFDPTETSCDKGDRQNKRVPGVRVSEYLLEEGRVPTKPGNKNVGGIFGGVEKISRTVVRDGGWWGETIPMDIRWRLTRSFCKRGSGGKNSIKNH